MLAPTGGVGPSITITAPSNNAQVTGIVNATADAADATGVQFYVDGTAVGTEDTTAPYAVNWDTRTVTNGAHTMTARADDDLGHVAVANPITVNVTNGDSFQNEILATGLSLPTAMKFLPDGRMLVAELAGKIKVLPAPYTTPDPNLFSRDHHRLSWRPGRHFRPGARSELHHQPLPLHVLHRRYRHATACLALPLMSRPPALSPVASWSCIRTQRNIPSDEHHGGAITFSNDGKIMFTTGEHFQGTPAQDLTSPWGKILRINMNGTVPTDNPFYDGAGPNYDAIWALGLRNPYRAYYDAPTDRMYIGDVGGNKRDRVRRG